MDVQVPLQEIKNMLDPATVVGLLNLKKGDYVADFGSGNGYFVTPLARSVAPDGKVFAIDIQRDMLDVVRAKSKLENLHNVEYIWSDLEQPQGSKLKNDFINLIIATNIFHQADQKEAIIKEAYRILRSDGRFALIEWEAGSETNKLGPPNEMRVAKNAAISLFTNQSFAVEKEFDAGSHHYGIIFVKK